MGAIANLIGKIWMPVAGVGVAGAMLTFVADLVLTLLGNPMASVYWQLFYGIFLSFIAVGILERTHPLLNMTEGTIMVMATWFIYVHMYWLLFLFPLAFGFEMVITVEYFSTFVIWVLAGVINCVLWKMFELLTGEKRWYVIRSIKI